MNRRAVLKTLTLAGTVCLLRNFSEDALRSSWVELHQSGPAGTFTRIRLYQTGLVDSAEVIGTGPNQQRVLQRASTSRKTWQAVDETLFEFARADTAAPGQAWTRTGPYRLTHDKGPARVDYYDHFSETKTTFVQKEARPGQVVQDVERLFQELRDVINRAHA